MKILYPILCYYPSEAGGPANTIYWLNQSLGKNGISCEVISTRYGLNKVYLNSPVLYTPYNINVDFINNSLFSFVSRKYLNKIKKSNIIHFSSLFFKPTLFYCFLGIIWSCRLIISPRGELYEPALSRKRNKKRLYLILFKLFQGRIEFHSTNSIETKQIKNYFPKAKSIVEIPNFIKISEKIDTTIKKQILFLGRINPIKNIHLLIEAYYRLDEDIKLSYKLLIVGDALLEYEKKYLSELINIVNKYELSEKIVFTGGVYGGSKELLLAESICTVLPSKSENFGNVVLESLCQGTPVIVSKNAPWELLEENNAGYWVKPTVSGIIGALTNIVSLSEEGYKKMRTSSLNFVKSRFDINNNINRWIDFYRGEEKKI